MPYSHIQIITNEILLGLPALSQQISRCPLGCNPIERFWAGLEKSWNGYWLDSQETVLKRAGIFIWKGQQAVVSMMAGVYEKGVKLAADQVRELEARLQRSTALKWWDITIAPEKVF